MPSIRRNSLYGLLGFAVPMGVTLLAYPVLLRHLGATAFGVYLLGSSIGSMAPFLNLGFAPGIAKHVAEDIGRGDRGSAGEVIVTGFLCSIALGCIGASVIWLVAPWLASLFADGASLQSDAAWVFRLAAVQLLAFLLIMALVALLKGLQRFDHSTLVLSALSVLAYGGAAAGALLGGAGLITVSGISAAASVATVALAGGMAWSLCRAHGIALYAARPTFRCLRRLARFGAFATVNDIAPALTRQGQRLLIGALIGPAAVTIFASATTMASAGFSALRAASEVVMPVTASLFRSGQAQESGYWRLRRIYVRGILASSAVGMAAMAVLFLVAPMVVPWWLGQEVAGDVVTAVRILCVGFALNSARVVPYHTLNGLGKPEFNTMFALSSPIGTLGLVLALAFDGLSVRDFALAFSGALALTSIAHVLFTEFVVWRRWVPSMLTVRHEADAALALGSSGRL